MKRRSFISRLTAGLVALPVIAKASTPLKQRSAGMSRLLENGWAETDGAAQEQVSVKTTGTILPSDYVRYSFIDKNGSIRHQDAFGGDYSAFMRAGETVHSVTLMSSSSLNSGDISVSVNESIL